MAKKSINPNLVIVAGLAIGAGVVVWKGKKALSDAGQAVNPVNPDNIFARGVNRIVQAVTGDPDQTLGGQIFDWVNGTRSATAADLRDLGTTQQGN